MKATSNGDQKPNNQERRDWKRDDRRTDQLIDKLALSVAYLDSDLERDIEREVKLGSIRSSLGGGEERRGSAGRRWRRERLFRRNGCWLQG